MKKLEKVLLSAGLIVCLAGFLCLGCDIDEPEPEPEPETTPQEEAWETSAHADETAESFTHWDEDGVIEAQCAKCHSSYGFLDFIGADGTAADSVDNDAELGSVISCDVCHQGEDGGAIRAITSVAFPSGVTISGIGSEAICMHCHQGRASKQDVDDAVAAAGADNATAKPGFVAAAALDDDTVSVDLGFVNIHYYAAGAILYGSEVQGGYEYDNETYSGRNTHTAAYDSCIECHNPHSLEVASENCFNCHREVSDFKDIRYGSSGMDYDGDGDTDEGIYYEISGMEEILYSAIQSYATQVIGTGIVYDAAAYPYFFIDTNGNGTADADEASFANRYNAWTPRLLKAAYNYQTVKKDPGGYTHNPAYVIELLQSSIADLNNAL